MKRFSLAKHLLWSISHEVAIFDPLIPILLVDNRSMDGTVIAYQGATGLFLRPDLYIMNFVRCIAFIVAALSVSVLNVSAQNPTVVAEIDGQVFTLQDFEREYAKTVGNRQVAQGDSLPEYTDFLRRYVNFLIKLKEADAAGYYEDEDLQLEINGYRSSFARPYLIDNEIVEPIIKDLYEKRKEYIHASHVMTTLPQNNPSPADTLRAWTKMVALQDSIRQGIPFGDLALRNSEDPVASDPNAARGYRGDLGSFTGGQMIKPFEHAAYSTPVGEVSDIVRSAYGYHIVKVHSREPTKPDYFVSHILLRFQGATEQDSIQTYLKMDSLKTRIDEGASFAELAKTHSEDEISGQNGGSFMAAIQYRNRNLDQIFHDALFALETPEQISDVVETPFGLHLIKLDSIAQAKTLEQQYDQLGRMARALPRIQTAEAALAKTSLELYTSTVDTLLLTRLIGGVAVDSLQRYLQELSEIDSVGAMPLITLEDSVYTIRDFAEFAAGQVNLLGSTRSSIGNVLVYVSRFLEDKALLYRSFELEYTDAEFKEIIQDFKDGLAIFKIMEDSVWDASSEDTLRLMQHFETNPEQYQWPDRYRLIELSGASDSLLTRAVNVRDAGSSWENLATQIAADSTWDVMLDTLLVAQLTGSIYDQATRLSEGEHTEILPVRSRKIVLYMDGMEAARPKTFEEAKTEVMTDIQVELEQRLHQRLRQKYEVKTFPDRLQEAFQSP